MLRILSGFLILLLFCWPTLLHAQEGRLERVREDVRSDSSGDNKKDQKGNGSGSDSIDLGDDFGEVFGPMILYGLAAPFVGPAELLGDDYGSLGYFHLYPYRDHHDGLIWFGNKDHDEKEKTPLVKVWLGRLTIEESNDFNGMNRVNGQLLIDTSCRLGFQGDWNWLSERVAVGKHDALFLGDGNLVFRFGQCEWAQFRSGLGFRVMTDDVRSDWGFNFTYGADFFPCKPWIISAQFDAGTLGNAAVIHGRVTGGAVYNRFEIFGGYDFLRIGSVNLQGPVLGLRLWF